MALNLSLPKTQLLVRTMPDGQGRVVPLVTDTNGVPLPMQRRVSLNYDHEGLAEVTVTFAVDGEDVQLLADHLEVSQ